ncbi:MAG: FKBP-type peptidyl-prolyl cis-trans isomerase [Coriobacteriales bacterium]|jgi:FKBP-type peptidyl-prolyl cis-trans isomerase 2
MVEEGQQVLVTYVGKLDDGTVFDSTEKNGGEPLDFIVGSGNIIAGFDEAVRDMEIGETRTVSIDPKDAYGDYDDSLLQTEKIEDVPDGDELAKHVGKTIYLQDKGDFIAAQVVSADNGMITVDFNHPLAGKRLNFDITLVEVREEPVYPHGKPIPAPKTPPKPGEKA